MSVDALTAITGVPITAPSIEPLGAKRVDSPDFSRWMTEELHALNEKIDGAGQSLSRLATGETANLHEVMIELENAKLAFQLALQVRNKLLEGYQDIMRMQV